ncbi:MULTISPECIES: ROK family transcriptional regulator [Pseudobutyrivibrio]|uniref:Sugar kinase of the NBD/HSP70 family, may contain an N-terminal HTH domain n=2 Tax=Pseudobutyrivibrio xylanivorans TaxID=185007 RepID=A0A1M5ZZS5_PSEXY|nr:MULTISPECIES: ROK family transcriptional regulator [Pseudobutyrivibrio]MDC7279837.1 ROK family transcriptional regulator [Butyrivibrio fibrisolvens]SCZ76766.1 Sugar kinase of the NBD/HSP70 family, may contain an N-terminal HTH domain [Pseudobutyrivibrio xylanivorans]SHI29725.1 Sugar kinase of the NBD/HSP70 family, may contain an N-terminal HTH domain [Pseudobutyrivibrio xylanivorans DSM 14809]
MDKIKEVAGNNTNDLVEMNRSAIVRILQQTDGCSRADIAKMTGLTQASVTKIVAVLIEMGIVSEVGFVRGNGNRRSIGLRLNAEKNLVIGVKFSRHVFSIGVFDICGKNYTKQETEFGLDEFAEDVLAEMKKQIHELLNKYKNIVAIGMAVPGPYLRKEGRIAMVTRMPSWHDVNFIDEFQNEFDKPFFIEQDANAGALAEWWFGNHGRPLNSLTYFLVGEGVGSGIVDHDRLLLGNLGIASEIGHISIDVNGPACECGNRGCLELYCSATAMLKKAKKLLPEIFQEEITNRWEACNKVFIAAKEGNEKALELVDEIAEYIGYGCVTLINGYDPEIIVIGDSISQGGNLLLPTINRIVKERILPEISSRVQIKISELTIDPTLYGAAAIATDKMLRKPSEYLVRK